MANVLVEKQSLINIGNALRAKLGETKIITIEPQPVRNVSKTPNCYMDGSYELGCSTEAGETWDYITIPGAASLYILIYHQTQSENDYCWIGEGAVTEMNDAGTIFCNTGEDIAAGEVLITGDTASFCFVASGADTVGTVGYWAYVVGFDENEEEIDISGLVIEGGEIEIINSFKPAEMAAAIDSIQSGGGESYPSGEEVEY